ncbi:MAG: hypothetical protein NZM05_12560, partial [Chloroherpetonaceae bacterium]|nr:hypothetical protein [Chloroherpetonaceae bacterium]
MATLVLMTTREKVDYAALTREASEDRLKRAGLALSKANVVTQVATFDFKEITMPEKLFVVDSAVLIYDNSSCKVFSYRMPSRKLTSTFFQKGSGAGEIARGHLSLSPTKQELVFSDIEQARITIFSLNSNSIKTIPVKFMPESANIIRGRLFVRSFYLDSLLAEVDERGNVIRQLPFNFSSLASIPNLGAQGEITAGEDRVLLWFTYATPVYEYSL